MAAVIDKPTPPPGTGAPLVLRVVAGPATGSVLEVGDEPLVLGRTSPATGSLAGDHELSREHARLTKLDDRLLVEDLGSTNGTFVNGGAVAGPTVLGPGDVVWLGSTTLLVQPSGMPAPAVPPVEPPPPSAEGGLLARIADVSDRHPKRILIGLLVFLILSIAFGAPVTKQLKDNRGFDPKSGEYVKTQDKIAKAGGYFPAPLLVLIRGNQPVTSAPVRAKVNGIVAAIRATGKFPRILTPYNAGNGAPFFISHDGKSTYIVAFLKNIPQSDREDVAAALRKKLEDRPRVIFSGPPASLHELRDQVRGDLQKAERFGFPLLFILAFFVFRSAVAALLPMAVGILTIFGTFLALRLVNALPGIEVNVFALNVVIALGLGLSIDYSLFILSRYREELARVGKGRVHTDSYGAIPRPSLDPSDEQPFAGSEREALRRTMMTSGRTILFSAVTVAVALASLCIFRVPFIYSMGLGGAVCALVAVLMALVAMPALLAALGPRINKGAPKKWRESAERAATLEEHGFWYRLSRAVMRRPLPVAIITASLLIALGLAFTRIQFTGVNSATLPNSLGAKQANTLLGRDFPIQPAAPINVLIQAPATAGARVRTIGTRLASLENVAFAVPPRKLQGNLWDIDVQPWTDGLNNKTVDLTKNIRALRVGLPLTTSGESSGFLDQQDSFKGGLPLALTVLVVSTLVILFLMTGSVILPVKSLIMNLLTLSAALGVLVLVFQDGRLQSLLDFQSLGKLDSGQPLLVAAISFGLSTDYAVFLLTRIGEARAAGASAQEAVAIGLQRTGRIVTQAALLFCVAVGAFVTSKVIFIKEVGLGMIIAVIVDSTIVRGLLVPALMAMLGDRNWWAPRPLRRLHEKIGLSEE